MTDDVVIYELKGLHGSNQISYYNFSNSKFKARFKEIRENVLNCIHFNRIWRDHIQYIFSAMEKASKEFNISVSIYDPEKIIETLYWMHRVNFVEYLPLYCIQVDFLNEQKSQIYAGRIKWNGKVPNFQGLIRKFFRDDPFLYFDYNQLHEISQLNPKFMKFLGFQYSSDLITLENGKQNNYKDIRISNNKLNFTSRTQLLYIDDFFKNADGFLTELTDFFHIHTNLGVVNKPRRE